MFCLFKTVWVLDDDNLTEIYKIAVEDDDNNLASTSQRAKKRKTGKTMQNSPSKMVQNHKNLTTIQPKTVYDTANAKQQQIIAHEVNDFIDTKSLKNKSIETAETATHTEKTGGPNDEVNLVSSSEVTTFIFKGAEYVQMPKEYYVQEKRCLLQKLQKYETIIKNIKQQIMDCNFS